MRGASGTRKWPLEKKEEKVKTTDDEAMSKEKSQAMEAGSERAMESDDTKSPEEQKPNKKKGEEQSSDAVKPLPHTLLDLSSREPLSPDLEYPCVPLAEILLHRMRRKHLLYQEASSHCLVRTQQKSRRNG